MVQVLLIEDDEVLRQAFELALSLMGYGVETAHNGKEGLAKLRKGKPDIILLDIVMPIMDGVAFLEKAKLGRDTPVITFSNLSDETKTSKMTALGACRHVLKSNVAPRDLDALIKEVLRDKKVQP